MKRILKVIIVLNGEDLNKDKLLQESKNADYIIAADGGLNKLYEFNIKPDLIIGDMDSVKSEILNYFKDVEIKKFSTDKDLTDGEIALQLAIKLRSEVIKVFAGTGSYFDHSYANIMLLLKYNSKIEIITSNSRIFFIDSSYEFIGCKNRRISFFPLTPVKKIKLSGFMYNYTKKNLDIFDYSISNVIIDENAKIDFKKGKILVILFDEGYR